MAYFVCHVADQLDLSAIESGYEAEERGQPSYHPRMMMKISLYGYCCMATSETLNARGEEFGVQRLAEVRRRDVKLPSQARLTSAVHEVQRFSSHEQQDDIRLIVAKRR